MNTMLCFYHQKLNAKYDLWLPRGVVVVKRGAGASPADYDTLDVVPKKTVQAERGHLPGRITWVV